MSSESIDRLAKALEPSSKGTLVVVTGAGISAPSGLATFRGTDPDAIWNKTDVSKATRAFFKQDPVEQWNWYLSRFAKIDEVRPNPAHRALSDLERIHAACNSSYVLVTQNIDTLHEQAGSEQLIKVHGSSDKLRCSREGCSFGSPHGSIARDDVDLAPFRATPSKRTLPTCRECGAFLRAHVLFFDEMYTEHEDYRFSDLEAALGSMRALLFVGTSFAVGVTEMASMTSRWLKVPAFAIDVRPRDRSVSAHIEWIEAPAETLLPQLVEQVRSGS